MKRKDMIHVRLTILENRIFIELDIFDIIKISIKIVFTDHFKAVLLLWILFVIYVSLV